MIISSSDETDLLVALHDGVRETPLWSTFVARLRGRFRADCARLVLRDGTAAQGGERIIEAGIHAARARQMDAAGAAFPGRALEEAMRPQRVYTRGDLVDAEPALDGVLAPGPMLMVRVRGGSLDGWLMVARAGQAFSAGDTALLAALAPHARSALGNRAALERAQLRERAATHALHRLGHCWIALDGGGRTLEADGPARRLIQRGAILYEASDGRLRATAAKSDRMIAEAVAALGADPAAAAVAIRLSAEPPVEMLLCALPDRADAPSDGAALIAYLREGPPRQAGDSSGQLATLFGLAPREARLALALASGGGIAHAAAQLGLSVESARNYSKAIYSKTGARSQADLTRLITTSLLALV